MGALLEFTRDEPSETILEAVRRDGAAVIVDALDSEQLDRVRVDLEPWVEATPTGRDDFSGRLTTRTGALVARSPACRDIVMDETVLALANEFLGPYANKIQLHLSQIIRIRPGQGSQPLHRDRLAWGGYVPREIEPQFNTIWALTDFDEENGATRVALGSPRWENDREAEPQDIVQASMPAGSVMLYSGSVIHGGGENRSAQDRIGMNITYTLAWLRTEENQFLSCPPEVAKGLDPDLQELLGYTMGNYALGYYSDPAAVNPVSDLAPPEFALGRKPRK